MRTTYQRNKQALVQEILSHHKLLRQTKQHQQSSNTSEDDVKMGDSDSDGRTIMQRQVQEEVQRVEQQQRELQLSKLAVSAGVVEVRVEPSKKKEWKVGISTFKQQLQIKDEDKLRKEIEEESKQSKEQPRPRKNNQQNPLFTGSMELAFRKRIQHSPEKLESQLSLTYSQQDSKMQSEEKQKSIQKKTAGKQNEQQNEQKEELPIMRLLKEKISSIQSGSQPVKDASMRVELSDASWSSLSMQKVNPSNIAKVNSLVSQATKTVQINLAAHSLRKIFGVGDAEVKPQSAAHSYRSQIDEIAFGGSNPSTVQKGGEQSESKSDVLLHLQQMGSSVLFDNKKQESSEFPLSELQNLTVSNQSIQLSKLSSCYVSETKRVQKIDIQLDSSLERQITIEKGLSQLDISAMQDYDSDHQEIIQDLPPVEEEEMEQSRKGSSSRDLEYSGSLSLQEEKKIISGVKQGIDRLKSRIESSFTSYKTNIDFDELEKKHYNIDFKKNIQQLKQRMEKDAIIGFY